MALDRFGRRIHYLRISLTDRCNLRCVYCLPQDTVFQPRAELMRDEELLRLARACASVGFDKFRLTGGEPTLRPQIVEIVRQLSQIPGVSRLTMTSNGVMFSRLAADLKAAGLQRVNFSLDTLDPEKFRQLTGRSSLEEVWAGIQAAEAAGLTPIKINAVILRGVNDDDMLDLAALTRSHAWQVRFIEMMPFAGNTHLQQTQLVTAGEMQAALTASFGTLEPLYNGALDGEARIYRVPGWQGTLGFISTLSHPFCGQCTRARLTADGRLRLCLLQEQEVDLLSPLRAGASESDLRQIILQAIWGKPWGHGLEAGTIPLNRAMSQIGG